MERIYPETLIENLPRIGGWSAYGLASEALQHYFPEAYDNDGYLEVAEEVKLMERLGLSCWQDVIIKYQKEIGYDAPNGFSLDCVNEY